MVVDILESLRNCLQLSFKPLTVIQQLYRTNQSFNQIYPGSKHFGQQNGNSYNSKTLSPMTVKI